MLLSLWFLPWGLLIVFGHNIWGANWQVIITVLGWFITLKCILYLLVPNWANFVNRWSDEFLQRYIQMAGGVDTILGAIILFLSFSP